MHRILAIIEREMRRFRRNPVLVGMSIILPLVQLFVIGYAYGGKLKDLRVGVVDQDRRLPAMKLQELAGAVAANARTFQMVEYSDMGKALDALRDGELSGVLAIPPDFSRRALAKDDARVALIADNTDPFAAKALAESMREVVVAYDDDRVHAQRIRTSTSLEFVELYSYVPYIHYLLPGTIVMSMFMMAMIGGGTVFIDDKARGLHEGYLVTPITRFELVLGFNLSAVLKAVLAGILVLVVGSVISGIPNPFDPGRLVKSVVVVLVTAFTVVSMVFLFMVRMSNPVLPRALFGVLNTFLYFPSGAVSPPESFPGWMRALSVIDPLTYGVHAFKALLLRDAGWSAIGMDLGILTCFSLVMLGAATLLLKRTL